MADHSEDRPQPAIRTNLGPGAVAPNEIALARVRHLRQEGPPTGPMPTWTGCRTERELRKQTVPAAPLKVSDMASPVAPRAGSESVVKTLAARPPAPSTMGGQGLDSGGTTSFPPGGRGAKA